MPVPDRSKDIILQPGDWHFGDLDTRIRTVLGTAEHLEGIGHRDVMFDVNDGKMYVRQVQPQPARVRCGCPNGGLPCTA